MVRIYDVGDPTMIKIKGESAGNAQIIAYAPNGTTIVCNVTVTAYQEPEYIVDEPEYFVDEPEYIVDEPEYIPEPEPEYSPEPEYDPEPVYAPDPEPEYVPEPASNDDFAADDVDNG